MSELLRIGTKNAYGVASPLMSDKSGVLSVTNSGRYLPYRGIGYIDQLARERKYIKSQYVGAEYVLLGNDEHMLDTWTYLTDTNYGVTLDSTVKDVTGYSARMRTANTSSYTPQINFATAVDFSEYDHLHMWIHCDDLAKINYFNITFECPDSSNKYAVRTSASASMLKEMGAIFGNGEIAIQKADFTATGNPNWNNVKRMYITLQAKTQGTDAIINIANMRMIKQKPTHAKIIMRMDDGLQSVHTVAMPIFAKYNVPGTCYINPEYVATDDSHKLHPAYGGTHSAMNLSELKQLHDMGWTICSHTFNHNLYVDPTVEASANYPRKHYSQAYYDLSATQDWLINNGFGDGADSHVYGNHYYNAETLKAATDIMRVDYSAHPVYSSYSPLPWAESVMHLSADRFVEKSGDTYPVIDALAQRGGICVPMFHMFEGDNIDGSVSGETLDAVLEYICSIGGVDIITAADLAYATPVALY